MRFNLLRYFSLASAVAVVAVTAILAVFYDRYATDSLVTSVEQQNVILASFIGNDLSARLPPHFKTDIHDAEELATAHHIQHVKKTDAVLKDLLKSLPILKVKAYWNDLTIYSSDHSQIGEIKSSPDFLIALNQGIPASKLSFGGEFNTFEGVISNRNIVETYVPIGAFKTITGEPAWFIVKIYTDVTPLVAEIEQSTVNLVVGLIFLFTAFYGVLVSIVRRADGIIGQQYVNLNRQITERKRTEEALRKSNRAFKTLSKCNRALVRLNSEEELFSEMCRVVVELGGYRLAWIGLKEEDEEKSVRPAAQHGFEDGYLETLDISWADTERGQGPTGTAIRTGKPVIALDILNDPNFEPWRAEAVKRGYASSVSLPLFTEAEVVGAFNIYAGDKDAFDDEEVQLLEELAQDISFGIRTLYQREQRRRAEEATQSLGRIIESSLNEIYVFDAETLKFTDVNRGARENLQYSMDELRRLTPLDLKPEFIDDNFGALIEPLRSGAEQRIRFETVHQRKDGSEYPVEVHLQFTASETPPVFVAIILDITERKKAEEALRKSEALFRAVVDHSPTKIHIKDVDGRYMLINKEAEKLFGVTGQQGLGKTSHDLFPKEMADAFMEHDRAVLISGKAIEEEEEFTLDDGVHTYLTVKFPIYDLGGVSAVGAIGTDITELKQAEQALKESEQRYMRLADNTPAGIWQITPDGETVYINNALSRMLELDDPEEAIGHFYGDFMTPDSAERVKKQAEKRRKGLSTQYEIDIVGKKGGKRRILLTGSSLFSEDGEFVGRIATLVDITERKNAEDQLRKLSQAVEQSPASVVITDTEGIIEYVNPKFSEITGYSAKEAIGQTPRLLKSGETPDAVYERLWAAIKSGKQWRGTMHNKRKNGTVYLADVSISPIVAPDGTVTNFIVATQDITQRVENERRLKQAEKMESLGSLAGGIAHDFNNMLLPILSLTDMTRKALPEDSRDRLRLDKVIEAATRAKDLVASILAFSRQEDAKRENIDIHATIREAMDLLHSTIPTTIKIKQRLKRDTGTVFADRSQLASVLLNLASNAADAIEGKQGEMTVSLSPVKVDKKKAASIPGLDEGKYAKLVVKDSGHGMDEETLARVMEPFFTTKPVGEGTGLGLSMVHGIVSKHGGVVDIASTPGEGTTVEVYLPLVEGEAGHESRDGDEVSGDFGKSGGSSPPRSGYGKAGS